LSIIVLGIPKFPIFQHFSRSHAERGDLGEFLFEVGVDGGYDFMGFHNYRVWAFYFGNGQGGGIIRE
jgi:hypothetical protein